MGASGDEQEQGQLHVEGSIAGEGKLGWDTESVTDETKNTHLWIVNRAADLAGKSGLSAGKRIAELLAPSVGLTPFRKQMCQGLYDADWKAPYNNPATFLGYEQPTYSSHFFDPDTGRNWLGQTSPTALDQGALFFNRAAARYVKKETELSGYELGLALHYFTDLSQPMHAANYTYLSSIPSWIGRHTHMEEYVMKIQGSVTGPSTYVDIGLGTAPDPYLVRLARQSKSRYYRALCPPYLIYFGSLTRFEMKEIDELVGPMLGDAIQATAQFLVAWMGASSAPYAPVFRSSTGIGGYDLRSPADRAFTFDCDSVGKENHLVLYRPGEGAIFIVRKNPDGSFEAEYEQGAGGQGIGTYDLKSTADRAFAFDYDSSGCNDHLVLYRPGAGATFIVTKDPDGTFAAVYKQGADGKGIGEYDLKSPADRGFAFDYDSSGKLDHLVFYRPGEGAIFIIRKNSDGSFTPVYKQGAGGKGIGGYDLRSPADRVFAFDYRSTGKLDHLVLYRPGEGAIFIVGKNSDGNFTPVYEQGAGGKGIGTYDLRSTADRAFAFDHDSSGKLDHLVLYRPGRGAIFIVEKDPSGKFVAVYKQGDGGSGIGGYDLRSAVDRLFPYDYDSDGQSSYFACLRPGSQTFQILAPVGHLGPDAAPTPGFEALPDQPQPA